VGVAILLHPWLADAVIEWNPINERVAFLRLKLKKTTLRVIQVYAPNLEAVLTTIESVSMTDSITVIRDFNVHVGNDSQTWNVVIGRHGDNDLNNQGKQLLDFCASSGLSMMNTFFQHKNIHKYTWYKTDDSTTQRSLIDFIMVSDNLRRAVADVRVKRGAELATDHHLVVCIVQLSLNYTVQKAKPKKMARIKWEALADEENRKKFAEKIDQQYSQLSPREANIESE
jgi:exonuclease III